VDGTRKLLVDSKKEKRVNVDVKEKSVVLYHDVSIISLAQDDAPPASFIPTSEDTSFVPLLNLII
jgi:hypothetical protein